MRMTEEVICHNLMNYFRVRSRLEGKGAKVKTNLISEAKDELVVLGNNHHNSPNNHKRITNHIIQMNEWESLFRFSSLYITYSQ